MRYSVRYEDRDDSWIVADAADANRTMGVHRTKAAAYAQATAEQSRWRKNDRAARHLAEIRRNLPHSLVVK